MKSIKILLICMLILTLIGNVSALNAYAEWEDGKQSYTLVYGENAKFEVDTITFNYDLVDIIMYNSHLNKIYEFEEYTKLGQVYEVNENIYQDVGNYKIIISGDDGFGADSYTLNLNVEEQSQNNPPNITSTPITEVEENSSYEYGVIANDKDNDELSYSLIKNPKWLSISNNKISGTAPEVSQDKKYDVKVKVSDGKDSVFQSYTLTVKNKEVSKDTTSPVITLKGQNPLDLEVFSDYNEPGFTAHDNVDGNLTSQVQVTGSINKNVLGEYILNYSVSDSAGNKASVQRIINVIDTTKPEITLLGNNPQNITINNNYVELGAKASDNYDGNLTSKIKINSSEVDTSTLGSYNVYYYVKDSSGNFIEKTRKINVVKKKNNGGGGGIDASIIIIDDEDKEEDIPGFIPYKDKINFDKFDEKEIKELSFWQKLWFAIVNFVSRLL